MANTMLPDNQEVEAMTQHEKQARECKRAANRLNRSARGRVNSPKLEASKKARESITNMTLPDDKEGEATTGHENKVREHERVANTSLSAVRRDHQCIPTSKKKSQQYSGLGVASLAMIAGRSHLHVKDSVTFYYCIYKGYLSLKSYLGNLSPQLWYLSKLSLSKIIS